MDPAKHYEEIRAILKRHFGKKVGETQLKLAAKELFALTAEETLEWEDMHVTPEEMGFTVFSECPNICRVEAAAAEGAELKVLRRKRRA